MKIIFLCLLFFCFLSANDTDYINFGGGVNNILREKHRTVELLMEYKFENNFKNIHPFLGFMGTFRGAIYAYAGFSLDMVFKDSFVLSPSLAAGYYKQGGGRDLGYPLEFRSCISVGYQFIDLSRINIGFYHISNASIGSHNPGLESLIIYYSFPLKFKRK